MSEREALIDLVDRYLDALVAHDPRRLAVTQAVRFTENGQHLELGRGLWRTVRGLKPGGHTFADPTARQVEHWGVISEMGRPAILSLRLGVTNDGQIDEIETLVVREGCRIFGPANVVTSRPYDETLDDSTLLPRQELVRIAGLYLDGIERGDGDMIPVLAGCARIENGVQTTRLANADQAEAPWRAMGVAEQIDTGMTRHIEAARDRRFPVVDEERGLVICHFLFDHPGSIETVNGRVPFGYPNSMMLSELFRIRAGRIHDIEAILDVFPYGMRSGW